MRVTTKNLKKRIARAKTGNDMSRRVDQVSQHIINMQNLTRCGSTIIEYKSTELGYNVTTLNYYLGENVFQSVKQKLTKMGWTFNSIY